MNEGNDSFVHFLLNSWAFSLQSLGQDTWWKNNNLCLGLNTTCESVKNIPFTHQANGIFYFYFLTVRWWETISQTPKTSVMRLLSPKSKTSPAWSGMADWIPFGWLRRGIRLPPASIAWRNTHTPTYRWGSSKWESNLMGLQLCQQELKDPGVEKKIKTQEISRAKDERR